MVFCHGLPDLEGAEERDAVFDVVKGDEEDVELAVPVVFLRFLEPGPVLDPAEAPLQVQPRLLALGYGVAGVGIDPVLEGIYCGDPAEDPDIVFQFSDPRPVRLGRIIKNFIMLAAQMLHAHGGHLGKFRPGAAIGDQGFLPAFHGMDRVAGLVEQRAHVALEPDRVHENKGQAVLGEHGLVAAGGFALAAVEVEQVMVVEEDEDLAEVGMDPGQNLDAALHQLGDFLEGAQRGAAFGVHRQVPGTERVEAQSLFPALLDAA